MHMLDAPLSLVPHHGGATPRMEVAEALIAAVMDSCETCTDQLTVLVMKGDPQVVAHLVGAGWRAWRETSAGRAPGAQVPGRRGSHRTLRMLLTRHPDLDSWVAGLGPGMIAELLEDALSLLVPTLSSAERPAAVRLTG